MLTRQLGREQFSSSVSLKVETFNLKAQQSSLPILKFALIKSRLIVAEKFRNFTYLAFIEFT